MTRRSRLAALCALIVLLAAPGVSAAQDRPSAPDLSSASAAILVDARDGSVILQKRPGARRSVASTTKLMTALLALERAEPDEVFTAPAYDALPVESKIDLRTGERMRVDDLFEALLLESANDAAVALATGVAGSEPAFVAAMNERAEELGLEDTSYANPIGLDDPANYSSARDLADLARRLLRNRRFAAVVDSPSATLESGDRTRVVENRNSLVDGYDFVEGVKTGHTLGAGYVLVGAASGRLRTRVVSVVLGEPSEAARDEDTLALLRYGLAQFRRVRALDDEEDLARASIAHHDGRVALRADADLFLVARRGQRVTTKVDAPAELDGELPAGEKVGSVAVLRGGRLVRRVDLVTAAEVPGAGLLRRVSDGLGVTIAALAFLLALAGVAVMLMVRVRRRPGTASHAEAVGGSESDREARRRARERARAEG